MGESLADLVARLRAEIDALPEGEEATPHLRQLLDALEARAAEAEDNEGLVDQLQEVAMRFEASHHGLAETLGRIGHTLGGAGI